MKILAPLLLAALALTASLFGLRFAKPDVSVAPPAEHAPQPPAEALSLAQRQAEQDVPRGEYASRILCRTHVVCAFETVSADSGTQTLALPPDLDAGNAALVGYVQAPATMRFAGASRVPLAAE